MSEFLTGIVDQILEKSIFWFLFAYILALFIFFVSLFISKKSKIYPFVWMPLFFFSISGTIFLLLLIPQSIPPSPGGGGEGILQILIGIPSVVCTIILLIRHPVINLNSFLEGIVGSSIFIIIYLLTVFFLEITSRVTNRETIYFWPTNKEGSSIIDQTNIFCKFPHQSERQPKIEKEGKYYIVYSSRNLLIECQFSSSGESYFFHILTLGRKDKYITRTLESITGQRNRLSPKYIRRISNDEMELGHKLLIQIFPEEQNLTSINEDTIVKFFDGSKPPSY